MVMIVPVVVVVMGGRPALHGLPDRLRERQRADDQQDGRGHDQVRPDAGLDVAAVVARPRELEQGTADQGEYQTVQLTPHHSTAPTATADTTATTNVAGAN